VDGEADGATNMAVDEAILSHVVEGTSPPTLRLYAWAPPSLSLGRGQPVADVDLEACHTAGVEVVRRPTGGRAILHTDELTYSVALLQSDPWAAGGLLQSYRRLSEGLLAGLQRLDVPAVQAISQRKPAGEPTAVCFETPAEYEITVGGCKLLGSAQWRTRDGVLQHGTLPLHGDITRILDFLALTEAERAAQREALRQRATTLEGALGYVVPFSHAAHTLADGFASALKLDLVPGQLSRQEHTRAAQLRRTRYATDEWTKRA
jgi:lipoate-protein ligase A